MDPIEVKFGFHDVCQAHLFFWHAHFQLHLFLPKKSFLSAKLRKYCHFDTRNICEHTAIVSQTTDCQTVEYDNTLECDNFLVCEKNEYVWPP